MPSSQLAGQLPGLASFILKPAFEPVRLLSHAIDLKPKQASAKNNAAVRQRETLNDRIARVSGIRVSPAKVVVYEGETLTFTALAIDSLDRTIQGVAFSWESSNSKKVEIDGMGRARFIEPGLSRITCRAGTVEATAPVLVRPGRRLAQTDDEWRRDQGGLKPDGTVVGSLAEPGVEYSWQRTQGPSLVRAAYIAHGLYENKPIASTGTTSKSPSLRVSSNLSKMSATASPAEPAFSPQGGGYSGNDAAYDELWSEPRNLVGMPRARAAEPTVIGTVMPEGSNLNMAVPIVSLPGRGLGINLSLYYNSRVWGRKASMVTFDPVASWPSPGFSLGFGRILTYDTQYIVGNYVQRTKYLLIDSDGTRHYMGLSDDSGYGFISGETTDGSHIKFQGSWSGIGITYSDGTQVGYSRINNRLLPGLIQDTNGNYITITYKDASLQYDQNGNGFSYPPCAIDYITDTLGRVIQFNYTTQPGERQLVSITAPGFNGSAENPVAQTVAQFQFEDRSVGGTFSGLTAQNVPYSFSALRRVIFPATGTGYVFSYSAYGMIYNYSMRRSMNSNDGTESAAVSFNYPTVPSSLTDAPEFTQRTESAINSPTSVYTYGRYYYTDEAIFVIFRPDATQLALSRYTATSQTGNGLLHSSIIRLSDWVTWRASTFFTYASDGGGSPQVQSVLSTVYADDGTSAQTKTDFDYDSYGNVKNKREYGFAINGQYQVRRRTRWVYKTDPAYISSSIRNRIVEVDLYDALENSNDLDDVLMAKTSYTYDDYQAMEGMEEYAGQPSPPGHTGIGASTAVRGNVTSVSRYIDVMAGTSITHLAKYDKYGNVVKAQISCCQEKTLTLTQNTYWSQPEQETSSGASNLTSTSVLDFNTSLAESRTDSGSQTTSYGYDAALRVSSVSLPTGAGAGVTFNDGSLTSTSTTTYDDGGVTKTLTASRQYDGWGRVIQEVGTNSVQVNTAYDAMGRVASRTNPFPQGGQPGALTTFQYDALGRETITTMPGGNTISNSYGGTNVIATDQVGRKIKRETDGLGRLVKVTEQDTSTGALTQDTTYTYSLLDKLVLVNQGGQQRAYKYDALGRVLYERIPEQQATINDGTGMFWTCKYTYTEFDAVATRQDARGVVTTYSYDTLHRLESVSYNTAAAPDVAATPQVNYTYGFGGLLASAKVGNIGETNYSEEIFSYDAFNRVGSVAHKVASRTYTTGYQYNGANQVKQFTYPGGAVVDRGYDIKARLNSIPGYLSAISYNTIGQMSSVTLGNGVIENYGYDPNRLQMTSQSAIKNDSPLLSLTYSYSAQAGQNGAGTTAGNTGQLMSISGAINGQTESAAYTYDNVGRIVTSNQTTNGASMQRRFQYDRWGNRQRVWDSVSGVGPIQAISYEGDPGVVTNRVAGVWTPTSNVIYSHDTAGNVTWDGAHSYQYDAENRLVSVDGGATASYSYDYQNRRVRKAIGASVTHYVWEGSQCVAEYNAVANTQIVMYVYAGSRMVAKVAGAGTSYFVSDRLSARLILDVSGNIVGRQSHLPFGDDLMGSGAQQKQHFTSYERDAETGMDYALNRQYSQAVGRFTRIDPVGESRQQEYPQRWNRYSYAANDPVNMKDPLGLFLGPWDENNPCSPFGPSVLLDGFDFTSTWCVMQRLLIIGPITPDPQGISPLACPAQDFSFAEGSGSYTADDLSALAMTAVGEAGSRFDLDEIQAVIASAVNRQSYNIAYFYDNSRPHFGNRRNPAPTQIIDILQQGYVAYQSDQGEIKLQQAKAENTRGYLTLTHYVCAQLMAARTYAEWVGTLDRLLIYNQYPVTFNVADRDNNAKLGAPNRRHFGDTTFWNGNFGPPELPQDR